MMLSSSYTPGETSIVVPAAASYACSRSAAALATVTVAPAGGARGGQKSVEDTTACLAGADWAAGLISDSSSATATIVATRMIVMAHPPGYRCSQGRSCLRLRAYQQGARWATVA